jgi:hypothetical protein
MDIQTTFRKPANPDVNTDFWTALGCPGRFVQELQVLDARLDLFTGHKRVHTTQ